MRHANIAAVMRAGAFSPNHIGNDAAILNGVVEQLRKRGCVVNVYSEEQFNNTDITEAVIVDMCRERRSIIKLQMLEAEGRLVINSGHGIENCTRERMTRLLLANDIPYPQSIIVDTDEKVSKRLEEAGFTGCWIKRGDFHAMHKEDVSYVRHPQEAQEVLQEYFLRGIPRAVINRHLPGDLVKFYGLANGQFFFWFYPFDDNHSKFGHEAINGKSHSYKFDAEALKATTIKAAEVLDVKVFGGDCIIDPEGNFSIIDFNDWPSFAPCRDEAAVHIAKYILSEIKKLEK